MCVTPFVIGRAAISNTNTSDHTVSFLINVWFSLSAGRNTKKTKRDRISVHGFYRIGKVIGDGNFAIVRECKNRWAMLISFCGWFNQHNWLFFTDLGVHIQMCISFRKTNKEYALKIISKAKVKGKVSTNIAL